MRLIKRVLDQAKAPVLVDQFTFLHAVALEAQGQYNQAIVTLEQFLEEYPGSPLAHEAQLRLGTLYTESQQPTVPSPSCPGSWTWRLMKRYAPKPSVACAARTNRTVSPFGRFKPP